MLFPPRHCVSAVLVAVIVMKDHFGPTNAVGLAVVIVGVLLFNFYKYRKIVHGELQVVSQWGCTCDGTRVTVSTEKWQCHAE